MDTSQEGNLSQTTVSDAPSSNLATETAQPAAPQQQQAAPAAPASQVENAPQSIDDIWASLSKSEPTAVPELIQVKDDDMAPPDEATPVDSPTEEAKPEGDNTVALKEGEDKFDSIAEPKKTDWDLIKEDRKAVIAKLNEIEPVVQKIEEIGGTPVLDFVAPIFARYDDPAKGVEAHIQAVKSIHAADPSAGRLHDEATYENARNKFMAWALEDAGISKEAYADYLAWQKGGQPTVTDVPPPQPVDGVATLPDGRELLMSDPDDKERYDLMLYKYQTDLEKRQDSKQKAEAAEAKRIQDEQAAVIAKQERERTAIESFMTGADKEMDTAMASLKFDAGSEEETAFAKLLTVSLAEIVTRGNKDFLTAMDEGRRLAVEGGTLAADKSTRAVNIFKSNLLNVHQKVMGMFSELHKLRQQVAQGGNLPKIPTSPTPPELLIDNALPTPVPQMPAGAGRNSVEQIWDNAFR